MLGSLSEMRQWVDRALTATAVEPTEERIKALHAATVSASLQGQVPVATAWASEAEALEAHVSGNTARGLVAITNGFAALVAGDADCALSRAEDALAATDDPTVCVIAMMLHGWACEFVGELGRALLWQEKALAIAESAGGQHLLTPARRAWIPAAIHDKSSLTSPQRSWRSSTATTRWR